MIEEFIPDPNEAIILPEYPAIPKPRVKLNPQEAFVQTAKVFAPAGVGLLLIWFGLTSTGSYYAPASRFGGELADIFYGWQAGTFLAMVGTVLVYDAIRRVTSKYL